MHCEKCGQPLEPWEVTTCEPCGEILQDSSTAMLTQTDKQSTLHQPGRKVQPTDNQQGAKVMSDTGLWNICVEDVQFPGGFGDEVTALTSNKGMPIIAQELEDGYRLLDGWGRISGLLNAGAEEVQAILVSDADIAERTVTGDDEQWNAAMYARYAPQYTYPGTTN